MKITTMIAAAVLAMSAMIAQANSQDGIDDTPSAAAMAADLLVVRPLGLVATVIGTGLFIVQLPLSLVIGEAPTGPAEKLVVEPARFTFRRPLGQMD